MTLTSIRMYKSMSSATVIRIACVMVIAGAWIRSLFYYLPSPVFWPILLGQAVISCAFPLFSSAITLLANKWGSDTEREMVIAMCCISIPFGNLIAFIYTGFSFTHTLNWSNEEIFRKLNTEIFGMNLMVSVFALGLFIFIKDKPDNYPSRVATKKPVDKNFWAQSKEAFQDRNFKILLSAMMLINGTFISFGTCIAVVYGNIKPVGFSSSGVSMCGIGSITCGVITAFIVGIILKKTKKNLLITRIFSCFALLTISFNLALMVFELPKYLYLVNSTLIGASLIPIVPVLINFAAEITFPQEPTVITGFMLMVGRIFGFLLSLVVTYVADKWDIWAFFILWVNLLIAAILTIFLKEDLKRSNFSKSMTKEGRNPRYGNRISITDLVTDFTIRYSVCI